MSAEMGKLTDLKVTDSDLTDLIELCETVRDGRLVDATERVRETAALWASLLTVQRLAPGVMARARARAAELAAGELPAGARTLTTGEADGLLVMLDAMEAHEGDDR